MKFVVLVALGIFASANAVEHDYMYFPDGNGIPHLIDLKEEGVDLTGYKSGNPILTRNVETITFRLFTIDNPTTPQLLTLNSISSVTESNWKNSRPTRFITHGWTSSDSTDSVVLIRNAYLAAGDYNVIAIDWSKIAGAGYTSAASSVKGVAVRVSEMIDFLNKNAGLDPTETKVIGHSLGAHVAGLAARLATGSIYGVVGLDPAMPMFLTKGPGDRIDSTDAKYVQIVHTNGGLLGLSKAVGDADFYPNGGSRQPGCGLDLVGSCAHGRSYEYFAESITNPTGFRATDELSRFLKVTVKDNDVYMGGVIFNEEVKGSFSLTTAEKSPYALG